MVFNPGLNRLTFSSFQDLPPEMRGCMAHQWLATWGIAHRMSEEFVLEQLPNIPDEVTAERLKICGMYVLALDAMVEARETQALAFAHRLGVALAALIATLKLAPEDAQQARPDWNTAHWKKWSETQKIVLAGGLFSGALGKKMFEAALEFLPRFGVHHLELILPDQPRLQMLKGAARAFETGEVIMIDAGHTAIKRGIAKVSNHQILEFSPKPMLEIPFELTAPNDLMDFLVGAMLELCKDMPRVSQFGISISVFIDQDGRIPTSSSSFYTSLSEFHLTREFEQRLAEQLGGSCVVNIMHEGQAAANSMDGLDAAILLGTSVGGGLRD